MKVTYLQQVVPPELASLKQWCATVLASQAMDLKDLKKPVVKVNNPGALCTLYDLADPQNFERNYGIVTQRTSGLCIIDFDDLDDTNPQYLALIEQMVGRTYSEYSLSGAGIHTFFNFAHPKPPRGAYIKAPDDSGWHGQLSITNNFMVCTGNMHPNSIRALATFTFEDLHCLLPGSRPIANWQNLVFPPAVTLSPTDLALDKAEQLAESIFRSASANHQSLAEAMAEHLRQPPLPGTKVATSALVTQQTKHARAVDITWATVEANLLVIPLDQNARVIRAWESTTKTKYEHYDFWLKIGMAIHHEASRLDRLADGYLSFDAWSATDPTAYAGQDDTAATWESFSNSGPEDVTYHTIEAMVRRLEVPWVDFNAKSGLPDQTSLANMSALLRHYSVQAYRWPGIGMFIDCDADVLNQVFTTEPAVTTLNNGLPYQDGKVFGLAGPFASYLGIKLGELAQQRGKWKGTHKSYTSDLTAQLVHRSIPMNPVKRWLDTPPASLPPILAEQDNMRAKSMSTFDNFIKAFKFPAGQDPTLSIKMLKAMLMQVVRLTDMDAVHEANEGMVVLIGPEGCHKTTFFRWMFPHALSTLIVDWRENVTSDKNKRDMGRALAGAGLFLLDECDSVLKGDEVASWLKAVLTSTTVEYTEIYDTARTVEVRTAIIAGTTNSKDIWLSNSGNRRMWLIEVDDIDIDYLKTLSRYWLYNSMVPEYKSAREQGLRPWIMNPEDFQSIKASNADLSARSSLYYDLIDEFVPNFTRVIPLTTSEFMALIRSPQQPNHPNLFTLKRIKAVLKMRGVSSYTLANTAKLRHELQRISQDFTGHRVRVSVPGTGSAIYVYKDGELHYNNRHAWVLPCLADPDDNNN